MKFLKNRKLIPIVAGVLVTAFVLYIFLAPDTMWKPIHIRFETAEAAAADEAATEGEETAHGEASAHSEAAAPSAEGEHAEAVPSPGSRPESHVLALEPRWGVMYPLDPKIVNLAEPGGLRYLQATLVLEMLPLVEGYYEMEETEREHANEEFQAEIAGIKPIMDDIVMSTLSSKTYNDVATIEGKEALKQELIEKINDALGYDGVLSIYFTEFVVQ